MRRSAGLRSLQVCSAVRDFPPDRAGQWSISYSIPESGCRYVPEFTRILGFDMLYVFGLVFVTGIVVFGVEWRQSRKRKRDH